LKVLLDNNLPPALAEALNALAGRENHSVEHLRKKFDAATPDADWIGELGREGGWIIISEDRRIARNRHEREALRKSDVITFVLAKSWKHQVYWEKASRLIGWWPDIVRQAEMVQAGAVFEVPFRRTGKFKQL
jgi:hypothetical protein